MTRLMTKMDVNPKKIQSMTKTDQIQSYRGLRADAYLAHDLIREEPDDTQQVKVFREELGLQLTLFATTHVCG